MAKKAKKEKRAARKDTSLLERASTLPVWKQGVLIFAVAMAARFILDLLFMLNYGWHAVNHIETWFYYGVAKGTHLPAHGLMDPTVWILRLWSFLPGELPFYGVLATSLILSSLTAVALFLLAKEEYNSKTGLYAGLIYALMVEPLALSLMGFTHDHLQLLLIVLALLTTVKAVKTSGTWMVVYAAAFLLIVYLGLHINTVIKIAVGACAVYVVSYLVSKRVSKEAYQKYLIALMVCIAFVGFTVIPGVIEGSLELMPQGRSGSVDLAPIDLSNLWLRFNVLLIMLPLALLVGYGLRDVNGLTLTLVGLVLCTVMDRGVRILDLGIAVLTAHLLANWSDKFNKVFAGLACLVFLLFLTQAATSITYQAIFLAAGAAMIFVAFKISGNLKTQYMLIILLAVGFLANILFVFTADAKKIAPEAEYTIFKWLETQGVKGKVLVGWDQGYYLEALTGLHAVSTPNTIKYALHDALWLPEGQAALELKRGGVEYLVVTDRNFNIIRRGNRYSFAFSGGLIMEPNRIPPIELVKEIAVYRLRNDNTSEQYFMKVQEITDENTGIKFMVYKVVVNESIQPADNLVTVFFKNTGGEKSAAVTVQVVDDKGRVLSGLKNATLKEEGVVSEMYDLVGDVKEIVNCSATVKPFKGQVWGYSGSMVYLNNGREETYNVSILLVDNTLTQQTGKTVTENRLDTPIHFNEGERKVVGYTFQKKYPDHQYMIAQRKFDSLAWIENESVSPHTQDVQVLFTFC